MRTLIELMAKAGVACPDRRVALRDRKNRRVPREGSKSRAIYDLWMQGYKAREIAKELSIPASSVHQLTFKFCNWRMTNAWQTSYVGRTKEQRAERRKAKRRYAQRLKEGLDPEGATLDLTATEVATQEITLQGGVYVEQQQ